MNTAAFLALLRVGRIDHAIDMAIAEQQRQNKRLQASASDAQAKAAYSAELNADRALYLCSILAQVPPAAYQAVMDAPAVAAALNACDWRAAVAAIPRCDCGAIGALCCLDCFDAIQTTPKGDPR